MADIFQCPRCGAITYRQGITIHDRYHEERDRTFKRLEEQVSEADPLQLQNWPTPRSIFDEPAEQADVAAADEPHAADDPQRWPAGF